MVGLKRRVTVAMLFVALTAMNTQAGETKPGNTPKSGFRAETLWQLDDVAKKIEDLAAAVPDEKYSWRPGEGVRSVSEVYMHAVGANYFFMTFLGVKPPMKMEPGMEKKVTGKAEIIEMMKPSFEHVRTAVLNLSDKDLDKTTDMFGTTTTYRNVLITEIAHLHEHLGQSVAYARMNGIVPPWTAAEQAAAAKKDGK